MFEIIDMINHGSPVLYILCAYVMFRYPLSFICTLTFIAGFVIINRYSDLDLAWIFGGLFIIVSGYFIITYITYKIRRYLGR